MKAFKIWLLSLLISLAGPSVAASTTLPREVLINGVEFVHVPAGWFWYAVENGAWNTAGLPGHPPHYRDVKVWLDGYYVAKFEARARDFKRFMESREVTHRAQYADGEVNGCSVRRNGEGDYFLVDEKQDLPATYLSWDLATEFARWMGFRLLTEGEWIKAARGADKRLWPWGNEYPDDTRAAYNARYECNPAPVDSFPLGKSPYGIYGMAGNVFELVQDWYNEQWDLALKDGVRNPVPAEEASNTQPYPGPMKILHGGRWSSPANGVSVYRRHLHQADGVFICFGTRFAIDESEVRRHMINGTAETLQP